MRRVCSRLPIPVCWWVFRCYPFISHSKATTNYFGIAGHQDGISRAFYVNSAYGGCNVDSGWFGILGRSTGCSWEVYTNTPQILFSPYGTKSVADGGIDGWQMADTFTIFADYDMVYDRCIALRCAALRRACCYSQLGPRACRW